MDKEYSLKIAEAILRVSVYIRNNVIKEQIEKRAVNLLTMVYENNSIQSFKEISVLTGLIKLSRSICEIEPVNASVLLAELKKLNSAIRQNSNLPDSKVFRLDDFFTDFKRPGGGYKGHGPVKGNSGSGKEISGNTRDGGKKSSSLVRQKNIIAAIKQSNSDRVGLREIISALPEFSERTIRYDIQKLCNQGVVKRVGNGGPTTHYVIE